jgi:hypothetical protein
MLRKVLIIILISINPFIFGYTLLYKCTNSAEEEWFVKWDIHETAEYLEMIRSDFTGERIFLSDYSGSIYKFIYKNKNNEIFFSGTRIGLDIEVSNVSKRHRKVRTITPDNTYWYQPLGLCFFDFVLSLDQKREFFFINPANLKPVYMTIHNKGTDYILIQGEVKKSIKAEIRLNGILAPFWRGKYWLCSETGIILRYLGTFGPGTRETLMELSDVVGEINKYSF